MSIPISHVIQDAMDRGGIIVDVRDKEDFLKGHIPMAVNTPLDKIEDGTHFLPKSRYLLVYCDYGGSSALAAKLLSQDGYKVINTVGGLRQYKGPLTRQR
jgi:rhodanese-related sulfurtransferase